MSWGNQPDRSADGGPPRGPKRLAAGRQRPVLVGGDVVRRHRNLCACVAPFVPEPARASRGCALLSAMLHVSQNLFLARTYRSEDLEQTCPIARGSSLPLVTLGAAISAGELPDALSMLGAVLVSAAGQGRASYPPARPFCRNFVATSFARNVGFHGIAENQGRARRRFGVFRYHSFLDKGGRRHCPQHVRANTSFVRERVQQPLFENG